jgi:hypothetical protein
LLRRQFSRGRLDPLIAAPPVLKRPAQSPNCRATSFKKAGLIPQLPYHQFSRGRLDPLIAVPPFFKRPARSPNCRTAIFQEAGAIFRLPRHDFSRGWGSSQSLQCHNFSKGWRYLQIAVPQFFFWPVQSLDCQAALWR